MSVPTFGPTFVNVDEDSEPVVVVRLALALSRDQLRAALAISHAEMAGEPPLPELSVEDIRREVEGYLGAGAAVELYRETEAVAARIDGSELLADVDDALRRAFPGVEL